jgi:hypothetical protein
MLGRSSPPGSGPNLVRGCMIAILALATSGGAAEPTATTTLDCGADALFVLLHLEGRPVALDQLEKSLPPRRRDGYSMSELAASSAAVGLPLDGLRFGKRHGAPTRPVIAFFKDPKTGHFAVLRPVGTTGKMVQVIDPPHVPWITDWDKLFAAKSWTGRILVRRDPWIVRNMIPVLLAAAGGVLLMTGLRRGLRRRAIRPATANALVPCQR